MIRYDFEVALVIWLVSMVGAYFEPTLIVLVLMTTLNLGYVRFLVADAAKAVDRGEFAERFAALERAVKDVRDVQNGINTMQNRMQR